MDDKEVIARSMPPPMDVAVDGNFAGKLTPHLMAELKGWIALPLMALGLAGLLALLLAAAKVPGAEHILPWTGAEAFRRILVAHVTFAFVVWYLGVQGLLTVVATAQAVAERGQDIRPFEAFFGRVAVYGAGLSFLLLLAPALGNLGTPSINNYIPVLLHPLFYAGLGLLAVCVALPIIRLLLILATRRKPDAGVFGVACAGVIFLIAMACIGAAWLTVPKFVGVEGTAEYVMWGGGHVLEFAKTALMLCGLYFILRVAFGETPMTAPWFAAAMLILVAGAGAGPLLYVTYVGGDPSQRMTFTSLYWFALPLPVVMVIFNVVGLLIKRRRDIWEGAPEIKGVIAALVLFAAGGLMGFFEGSVDTRTPAHYHAMLLAVTLVFMTLYFGLFLPLAGKRTPRRRLRSAMYLLLGIGQLIQSSALYVAGTQGLARKIAGADQDFDNMTKTVSMTVQGTGGGLAVIGGIIFIVLAARLLLASKVAGATPGASLR